MPDRLVAPARIAMLEKLPDALGHALREQRAGLDKTAFRLIDLRAGMGALEVKSLAFVDHAPIPAQYTADGPGISPPLQWIGVPSGASSLVLIVEDADAPTPQPLVHAIVAGAAGRGRCACRGAITSDEHPGAGYKTGRNSYLQASWLPPDPPPGPRCAPLCVSSCFALDGSATAFSEHARSRRGARGVARPRDRERLPDRDLRTSRRLDQGRRHRDRTGLRPAGGTRLNGGAARRA
jgi:phosphatidylethanolamine-binding protein (PEBP) family uncharacterized protein